MINKVFRKLDETNIDYKSRILCAISGGIDSVIMLHCLYEYGLDCIVAHCNFGLRGDESDNDELFVKKLAEQYEFKFISERFDTETYAEKAGISIQMAARDLRFEWFYEMAEKNQCDYIALAHNADDQVETIIFNLTRGTGIRGLCGMRVLKGKLLRPILEIPRSEIEEYAKVNYIEYRTDSTNIKTEYSRNKIRHLVFPLLEEINPSFRENAFKTSIFLRDVNNIFDDYILKCKSDCVKYSHNKIYIDLDKLKQKVSYKTVLFELLKLETLPNSFAAEVLDLSESQSGKICKYRNIEVLKDRNFLIIRTVSVKKEKDFYIDRYTKQITVPIFLNFTEKIIDNDKIITNPDFAMLDADKISFPIKLRRWKAGDRFKPLGMNQFKKLSNFFTDIKLNVFTKSEIWLLVSGEDIIWIPGIRIDDRFKITEKTKNIMIIEYKKQ